MTETVKNVTSVKHMIDAEYFKHILVTFGDKMTQEEIDDMFDEFDFDDDGFIMTKSVVRMSVSRGDRRKYNFHLKGQFQNAILNCPGIA